MASRKINSQLNHQEHKRPPLMFLQNYLSSLNTSNRGMVFSASKAKLSPRITEGMKGWGLLQAALLFCLCFWPCAALAADFAGSLKGVSITDENRTNQPPVAVINYTKSGATFTFDASGSSDPDGTITTYKWNFGDGSSGMGQTVAHQFSNGKYFVGLQLLDNQGGISISGINVQQSLPAWTGEVANRWVSTSSAATTTIPLTKGLAVGDRAVVFVNWLSGTQTLASVSDSKGNTYSVDNALKFITTHNVAIVSATVKNPLSMNDIITLKWGTPMASKRWGIVGCLTGTSPDSQPDIFVRNTSYGTSISVVGQTTAVNTAIVGIVLPQLSTVTFTPRSFISIGEVYNSTYYLYLDAQTSGPKDMEGVLSSKSSWGAIWVAYD